MLSHEAHLEQLERSGGIQIPLENRLIHEVGEVLQVGVTHSGCPPRLLQYRVGCRSRCLAQSFLDIVRRYADSSTKSGCREDELLRISSRLDLLTKGTKGVDFPRLEPILQDGSLGAGIDRVELRIQPSERRHQLVPKRLHSI